MVKFWTREDLKFVSDHRDDMLPQAIAGHLGRTCKAVEHMLYDIKKGKVTIENGNTSVEVIPRDTFVDLLLELIKKDYKIKRFPDCNLKSKGKSVEILNLLVSDMHGGKINTWYEPQSNQKIITYDDEIRQKFEGRFIKSIMRLLSLWQHGYFFEKLNILLLGDILDNDRIFKGQKTCITMSVGQQIWAIVSEIVDMINALSPYFPKIEITGIVGNHGRSTLDSKEEEPVQNNFEYQLYRIMQLMLSGNKKVTMTVPETRFYSISNYNHRIFMSHGDTIRGYTISYAERKAKELLINLPSGYNLYCIGHRHRADRVALSPTAELLINGCWIPNDDYAFKLYGTSTQPCQWAFGSSEHRVISSLCVPIDFRSKESNSGK